MPRPRLSPNDPLRSRSLHLRASQWSKLEAHALADTEGNLARLVRGIVDDYFARRAALRDPERVPA
jgi:hypothetical protein